MASAILFISFDPVVLGIDASEAQLYLISTLTLAFLLARYTHGWEWLRKHAHAMATLGSACRKTRSGSRAQSDIAEVRDREAAGESEVTDLPVELVEELVSVAMSILVVVVLVREVLKGGLGGVVLGLDVLEKGGSESTVGINHCGDLFTEAVCFPCSAFFLGSLEGVLSSGDVGLEDFLPLGKPVDGSGSLGANHVPNVGPPWGPSPYGSGRYSIRVSRGSASSSR